jgi:hypothetical protein
MRNTPDDFGKPVILAEASVAATVEGALRVKINA